MTRFRVATYNVHKCKGVDWRISPQRIADVILELGADLLGVQEILHSQAEALSMRLKIPFTFGAARWHKGEPYGNAVFTQHSVLSAENYDLTTKGRESRQCMHISIALPPAEPIHFFALHLGTSFLERRAQARLLVSSEILQRSDVRGARIVVGDFNEWTRGLATQMLTRQLQRADIVIHLKRRTTYPGVLPFLYLDHIYFDARFRLRAMHLHRTRLALLASDHLPLAADFET